MDLVRKAVAHLFPGRQGNAALDQAALVEHGGHERGVGGHVDEVELLVETRRGVVDLNARPEGLRLPSGRIEHRDPHVGVHLATRRLLQSTAARLSANSSPEKAAQQRRRNYRVARLPERRGSSPTGLLAGAALGAADRYIPRLVHAHGANITRITLDSHASAGSRHKYRV